jgi:hypothetical protein
MPPRTGEPLVGGAVVGFVVAGAADVGAVEGDAVGVGAVEGDAVDAVATAAEVLVMGSPLEGEEGLVDGHGFAGQGVLVDGDDAVVLDHGPAVDQQQLQRRP